MFFPPHIMSNVNTPILLTVRLVSYFLFLINISTNVEVCVSCDEGVNVQEVICYVYDQILHL